MITLLGTHQGFAVVEQDCEGFTTLHVIADEGKGQWDVFPLLSRTFSEVKVAIDQWIAYEKLMDTPEEYDTDIDITELEQLWENE